MTIVAVIWRPADGQGGRTVAPFPFDAVRRRITVRLFTDPLGDKAREKVSKIKPMKKGWKG